MVWRKHFFPWSDGGDGENLEGYRVKRRDKGETKREYGVIWIKKKVAWREKKGNVEELRVKKEGTKSDKERKKKN